MEEGAPVNPKWYLAIPILPKLLALGALAGIGAAYAADPAPTQSVDVLGELWAMGKAAGVLGFVVVYWLWTTDAKRRDKDAADAEARHAAEIDDLREQLASERMELKALQAERNSLHERSLTALINLDKTMEDQTSVTRQMVESTKALIQWLRHEKGMPPAD